MGGECARLLLIASALSLVPLAVTRADELDIQRWYEKAKEFAKSLVAPEPSGRGDAKVPAEGIDPKMAMMPRGEGRMRVIAPPGSPGGDPRLEPR